MIVLVAGAISGLAGFGFGLISVPPLLLIFDPPTVVVLVKVLALASSWVILLDGWRHIRWRTLWEILPAALVGQILGLILLRGLDASALKVLASAVVVGFSVLLLRGLTFGGAEGRGSGIIAGGISGILSTSTGLSGPPIVLLFTLRAFPIVVFRATTVAFFIAIDLISIPALAAQGIIDRETTHTVLLLLFPAFLGRALGARLTRFISPPQFRRVVLALLLLTGAIGIISALPPLR